MQDERLLYKFISIGTFLQNWLFAAAEKTKSSKGQLIPSGYCVLEPCQKV